jgi:hypothetical protein
MNLTCDGIREHLLDHHAGELVVEIQESFEAHLVICENCLHFVASYRHTVKLTRALPRCELPAAVEARLRARLKDHLT